MPISFNGSGGQPGGPLARILAAIVGVLALVAALMASLVFVVVIAVVGLAVWGYFWWKTRALRKQLREQGVPPPFDAGRPAAPDGPSDVIEGEAVRIVEEDRRLPDDR